MANLQDLDRPELARLWQAVSERLQRNGVRPTGVVQLDRLDRGERHALAGILGRSVTSDRARIDLARLDDRVRASGVAGGLVPLVQAIRGPLVDRRAERDAAARARAAVWDAARDELTRSGFGGEPWVEPWLEQVRRSGVLGGLASGRAEQLMRRAVATLRLVPGTGAGKNRAPARREPWGVGRTDLASRAAGSSHALDEGRRLTAVVLRALALALDVPYPSTSVGRRELWQSAGVRPDEVSTTVLTAGLRPAGGSAAASWLRDRSDRGWESHLTWRDIQRLDWSRTDGPPERRGPVVSVCENPRVLEAAVDAGSRAAIVCTQGNPTIVVHALLERLTDAGCLLRYHGDFDWPGVAIAATVLTRHDAAPWRFTAADYEAALGTAGVEIAELPPLDGAPAPTPWDPDLGLSMRRRGRIVHEELVLADLVTDLTNP